MAIHIPLYPKTKKMLFVEYRREILIVFCVLLAIIISIFFPVKTAGESFWTSLFFFLLFPVVVIKFVLKENMDNFGLYKGNSIFGAISSLVVILLFFFFQYYLIFQASLGKQIPIASGIFTNYWVFLFFELLIATVIAFSWVFFFQGFIQLGMEKRLGFYSVPLQALLYSLFFVKASWISLLLAFLLSFSTGIITYKSRSVIYAFLSLWIISVIADIMIIRATNQGIL